MDRRKDKIRRRKKWARHWKGFFGGRCVQRTQSSAMRFSSVPGAQCGWLSFGFGIWQKLRMWLLTCEKNKGPFVFSKVETKGLYVRSSSHSLTTQNGKPWALGAPETEKTDLFSLLLHPFFPGQCEYTAAWSALCSWNPLFIHLMSAVPCTSWPLGTPAMLWVQSPQCIPPRLLHGSCQPP